MMATRSYAKDIENLKEVLSIEARSTPKIIMLFEHDGPSDSVTASGRDKMACHILSLTKQYNYNHKIFTRAIAFLDAFLSTSTVKNAYAKCTAVTCLYMAVKYGDETSQEVVNSLLEILVERHHNSFSQANIKNIESIILQKLKHHVHSPSVEDFINCFHSLALTSNLFQLPKHVSINSHLSRMYKTSQHIVCSHHFMKFKASILGLAILGCDLKMLECDWLSTILSLQTVAQIKCGELSVCYEAIAAYYPGLASQYKVTPAKPARLLAWKKLKESKSSSLMITGSAEIVGNKLSSDQDTAYDDTNVYHLSTTTAPAIV